MKRYTHMALLATAMLVSSAVQAGPLDKLKVAREGLVNARIKVQDSEKMLQETFAKIDKTVVTKVGDLKGDLEKQSKNLGGVIESIEGIPSFVHSMLCFGDLMPTLNNIKDGILKPLNNTMEEIHTNFKKANDLLDPETDPQEVYKNLKGAYAKFDSAVKQLDALLAAMAAM